ncbi:MAG: hypothetical protein JF886_06200 [Candidatus Dormibacteraeota bacterium]|uniref:Uncharacterized protein n=1 Tax=Candidatus Aeolococcus gillhamiae TaxID=3127015 RepID=A0A2W5YZT1_9BACT|nr:hypothetical protein [Candidatus Dormibacteraeota bacterium]PZR78350.1 MAG: hypothetical protein DLM65_13200 [Candidatus Dormibacter sp. RRmetagenome_bin12]
MPEFGVASGGVVIGSGNVGSGNVGGGNVGSGVSDGHSTGVGSPSVGDGHGVSGSGNVGTGGGVGRPSAATLLKPEVRPKPVTVTMAATVSRPHGDPPRNLSTQATPAVSQT